MSPDKTARDAMRVAECGSAADTTRLAASVPELLHSARRIRAESNVPAVRFEQLAAAALPRLAAATVLVVVLAAAFVLKERSPSASPFESVVLGGDDETIGDAVFDAVFGDDDDG